MKNKVIDYMTPTETCRAIGISESSVAQITRWVNEGRIKGAYRFGKALAIPVSWVKSECIERGIPFDGIELKGGDKGVSLDDYIPLIDYVKEKGINYGTFYARIKREQYKGDYIRFQTTYGLPK